MNNIIFLMGVPRSGTTMLQKMITRHSEVSSVAEPWLLLPLMTNWDPGVNLSLYGHQLLRDALDDLSAEVPLLEDRYRTHVKNFVYEVYDFLRGGRQYFLDKSPRYYLISKEMRDVFTSEKFIYLFRNPVDIFDSTIATFCKDRLYKLSVVFYDLAAGLNHLCDSTDVEMEGGLVFHLTYESLCRNPESSLIDICRFLNLPFEIEMKDSFQDINFKGAFGDPLQNKHQGISSVNKGDKTISFFRRRLYLRLIDDLSDRSLNIMGYRRKDLIAYVSNRGSSNLISQFDDMLGYLFFRFSMAIGFTVMLKFKQNKRIKKGAFYY